MKNRLRVIGEHRDPPAHVLAGLRSIDENAELHYAGEGVWVVGVVVPRYKQHEGGRTRRQSALKLLAHEYAKMVPDRSQLKLGWLMYNDFFEVCRHTVIGEPTSAIVHDFAERDWNWRFRADEAFEANLDFTEGGPETRAMRAKYKDYAETEARDAYRYTFKNRRTVQVTRDLTH